MPLTKFGRIDADAEEFAFGREPIAAEVPPDAHPYWNSVAGEALLLLDKAAKIDQSEAVAAGISPAPYADGLQGTCGCKATSDFRRLAVGEEAGHQTGLIVAVPSDIRTAQDRG